MGSFLYAGYLLSVTQKQQSLYLTYKLRSAINSSEIEFIQNLL